VAPKPPISRRSVIVPRTDADNDFDGNNEHPGELCDDNDSNNERECMDPIENAELDAVVHEIPVPATAWYHEDKWTDKPIDDLPTVERRSEVDDLPAPTLPISIYRGYGGTDMYYVGTIKTENIGLPKKEIFPKKGLDKKNRGDMLHH
jgi:hypothetical protein